MNVLKEHVDVKGVLKSRLHLDDEREFDEGEDLLLGLDVFDLVEAD